MKINKSVHIGRAPASVLAIGLIATLITTSIAQTSRPTPMSSPGDAALTKQIAELRAKIANLEAVISSHSQQPTGTGMNATVPFGPMAGMSAGPSTGMAGMANNSQTGTSGMSETGGMQGMQNMMGPMEGMDMMGMMSGMQGMQGMQMPQSALPGFPGASHIYHIGATGFFLDHAEHIGLSTEQQIGLNKIKEQALLSISASNRQIEQAEQELATLTSSDQPDLRKIEAKVRDIAKLGSDQRIAFIKAVGEAAKLLTDEQRKILTGFATPAASPMPTMSPMEHM